MAGYSGLNCTQLVFEGSRTATPSWLHGTSTRIGAITAYCDNLVIAVTYVYMLGRLTDVRGLSVAVAWLKGIGTGMNTIFMFRQFFSQVPEALVEFPPLGHAPLKERFKGALRPI